MNSARILALAIATALNLPQAMASTDVEISISSRVETYIVRFPEPGLMYYAGGVERLPATAPATLGSRKVDGRSPSALAYSAHLRNAQEAHLNTMASILQRPLPMLQSYWVAFNGVAVDLTAAEADALRALPEISRIEPAGVYELSTDAGPAFIGAPSVWSGSSVPGGIGTRGAGVVVGVIDSGANSDHPSFANDASCGFGAPNPKLLSARDCNQASCIGGNPEDISTSSSGHGVHTSSTAAGNALVPPLTVSGVDLRFPISGVAPCAAVRSYKACESTCPGAALLAAMQSAILDGVDVLNYSISGGTSPWSDFDRDFLDMVNADIMVAASAGNTRQDAPDPVAAVNHRGPWVLSVANSSHDRIVAFDVDVAGGPQDSGAVPGTGIAYPTGATTAQVASAALLGNELGCTAGGGFAAGSMTGRIALISRGTCGFLEKVNNATGAGAIAAIVYNNANGLAITMGALETTTIPSAMVSNVEGIAIRDFIALNTTAPMTVTGPSTRVTNAAFGDILNTSSLRGPNNTFDVTKPDITGPGTNVYAAVSDVAGQFGFLTGTSMSSPHLAGAAALLRSAHPTWTPMEVKSALQLTSLRDGRSDNATTPWHADEVGNGRVDLNRAADAGLVMNETFANFLASNPGTGGQPRNLNLPSLRHTTCPGICTFTRTFRNTSTSATTWDAVVTDAPAGTQISVSPASFSFSGGLAETQTVTISVIITNPAPGIVTTAFGHLIFREAGTSRPDARLSVAIRGTSGDSIFANGFE